MEYKPATPVMMPANVSKLASLISNEKTCLGLAPIARTNCHFTAAFL